MPKLKYKFANHSYRNMHRLEHKGKIGFGTGENISTHIVNVLDDEHCYKEINGKMYVRSLKVKTRVSEDGERRFVTDDGKFIPLSQHFKEEYPQLKNPLSEA